MVLDVWTVTLEVKKQWWNSSMSINTTKYNFKEKKKSCTALKHLPPDIY